MINGPYPATTTPPHCAELVGRSLLMLTLSSAVHTALGLLREALLTSLLTPTLMTEGPVEPIMTATGPAQTAHVGLRQPPNVPNVWSKGAGKRGLEGDSEQQALVYDILPPATAVVDYAMGLEKLS